MAMCTSLGSALVAGLLVLPLWAFSAQPARAVTLSGTGATGVSLVGAITCDASFRRGSCIDLFNGCVEPAGDRIVSGTKADSASPALLKLFNLGGFDAFTDDPANVAACPQSDTTCKIYAPYQFRPDTQILAAPVNASTGDPRGRTPNTGTLMPSTAAAYAIWTPMRSPHNSRSWPGAGPAARIPGPAVRRTGGDGCRAEAAVYLREPITNLKTTRTL